MQATVNIDLSRWKQAAIALQRTSSRSCVDFINGQALYVVINAVRVTEEASNAAIEHALGTISRRFRYSKKTGKIRLGKRTVKDDSLAERILGERFKKLGHFGFKGVTNIKVAIQKLISSRVRSTAFIRSGWIPARNKLFSVVKKKPSNVEAFKGAKQYGKPKGSAIPAAYAGLKTVIYALIKNTALNQTPLPPGRVGNPMPVAKRGLQRSLDIATKDMIDKLAERLRGDLRDYGAR